MIDGKDIVAGNARGLKRNYAKGGYIRPTEDGEIRLNGKSMNEGFGKLREEFIKAELEKLDDKRRNYEQELKELTQLYYLKVTDSPFDYLSLDLTDETWAVSVKEEVNGYQTRFTKEEIMEVNEGLWSIAVPVEEDDKCDA